MKIIVLSVFVASVIAQQGVKIDPDAGKSREQIGHKVVPGGTAPVRQDLTPRFTAYHPEVKRTKVRYGPYTLPSIKTQTLISLISGEPGTMSTVSMGVTKPCDSNCGLVAARAGLEYANGTIADNSNGAWLHHVVMVSAGSNKTDNVCGRWILPGERFFSSGNERTITAFGDIGNNKIKSVFPLATADTISAQLELMNLNEVVKSVYLTVDWEYIPGSTRPANFGIAKALWLDVGNCGISPMIPPRGKTNFALSSRSWASTFDGEMLGVGGHLHDGGVHLNVYVNDKVVCKSVPKYVVGGAHGHGRRSTQHSGRLQRRDGPVSADGKAHIAEMSTCSMMGRLKKNDKVRIDAAYDFKQHEGMKSPAGAYTEVMGIAIMYAAADP